MIFRTELNPSAGRFQIDPDRPIALLGSCFAANIGGRLESALCDARINPCGPLFNPRSILNAITASLSPDPESIVRRLTFRNGDLYGCFLTDTSFSSLSEDEAVGNACRALDALRSAILECATLVVTLGTAWTYSLSDGYVVSNCHKLPADTFTRRRLTPDDVSDTLREIATLVRQVNPGVNILFTVSPVRHLKDGFHGNAVSKAILQVGCDNYIASDPAADYFPAAELLLDDLRDYRFYAADLTHPSEEAIDYIWLKFQQTFFSPQARARIEEGEIITRRLRHRHLHPDSPASIRFDEVSRRMLRDFKKLHAPDTRL